MPLSLYRRHVRPACKVKKVKTGNCCQCPIWVQGVLGQDDYIRETLHLTDWKAASKQVERWNEAGTRAGERSNMAILDAIKNYLSMRLDSGVKPPTIAKDKVILYNPASELPPDPKLHQDQPSRGRLISWCEDKGYCWLRDLEDPDRLLAFRKTWTMDSSIAKQKNQERLKSFFKFCKAQGYLKDDPSASLPSINVSDTDVTLPFTVAEMRSLLSATNELNRHGKYGDGNGRRMLALILLMRFSGLSITDAWTLERHRVDHDGYLNVRRAKTGTWVQSQLPPMVREALLALPPTGSRNHFFWTGRGKKKTAASNADRSLQRVFALSGVSGTHSHRFRDTFAVDLLNRDVSVNTVALLLGNSPRIVEKHYRPFVRSMQEKTIEHARKGWAGVDELTTPPA